MRSWKPLLENPSRAEAFAGGTVPDWVLGTPEKAAQVQPVTSLSRHAAESTRRAALLRATLLFGTTDAFVEARAERPVALRFFLTEAPPASVLSELPPYAGRAFVAEVRVLSVWRTYPPEWPPGQPPPTFPYALRAELEVTATIAGAQAWWQRQRVHFGSERDGAPFIYPLPPERDARRYFVVSFLDEKGRRTLLGFPVSREDHEAWRRELNGNIAR